MLCSRPSLPLAPAPHSLQASSLPSKPLLSSSLSKALHNNNNAPSRFKSIKVKAEPSSGSQEEASGGAAPRSASRSGAAAASSRPKSRAAKMSVEESDRLQQLEDELVADNVFDYLLPRQVRVVLLAFSSASCLIGGAIGLLMGGASGASGAAAFSSTPLTDSFLNLGAALVFGGLAWFDSKDGEKKIEKRAETRKKQLEAGVRELVTDESTGRTTSRLKEVNDDWILRKLERWGRKDNLPFVGPIKAEILRGLIRDKQPKVVVEVGTQAGYSAIAMAQALPPGARLYTIEKDLQWALAAKRFIWQASQGEKNRARDRPLGDAVSVLIGQAADKIKEAAGGEGGKIDFLFLDGVPKETLSYLLAAEPYLLLDHPPDTPPYLQAPGCLIVADNAGVFKDGGMKSYLEYVRGGTGETGGATGMTGLTGAAATTPSGYRYVTRSIPTTLEWREDVPDALEVSEVVAGPGWAKGAEGVGAGVGAGVGPSASGEGRGAV